MSYSDHYEDLYDLWNDDDRVPDPTPDEVAEMDANDRREALHEAGLDDDAYPHDVGGEA